jgi:hypothetical protein
VLFNNNNNYRALLLFNNNNNNYRAVLLFNNNNNNNNNYRSVLLFNNNNNNNYRAVLLFNNNNNNNNNNSNNQHIQGNRGKLDKKHWYEHVPKSAEISQPYCGTNKHKLTELSPTTNQTL